MDNLEQEQGTGLPADDFALAFEAAAGADVVDDVAAGAASGAASADAGTADDKQAGDSKTPEADDAGKASAGKAEGDDKTSEGDQAKATKPESDPAKPAPSVEEAAAKAVQDALAAKQAKDADDKAKLDAQAAEKEKKDAAALRESFSEDEAKLIEDVAKDFPEVLKAIEARERVLVARMENVFSAKLADLMSQIDSKVSPALGVVQDVNADKFKTSVLAVHADAFEILPKIEEWVATKPTFLRASYDAVLDNGTAEETIELYNIFKKETGSAQTPETPSAEDVAAQADKEKRLKAQEGVKGRHTSGGRAAVDPNDFEGAFEKFAASA